MTAHRTFVVVLGWLAALVLAGSSLRAQPAQRTTPLLNGPLAVPAHEAIPDAMAVIQERESWWRNGSADQLTMTNRRQGLRAMLSHDTLTVVPRDPDAASWLVSLRTDSVGRAGKAWPVPAAERSHEGRRVELSRPGLLDEWFVNTPDGVEQGWTLHTPPAGQTTAPVQIEVAFSGLAPRAMSGGLSVQLVDALGTAQLSYHGLSAWDATGRVLPATMTVKGSHVIITVHDKDAVYPVTIDPVLGGVAWSYASDSNDAWLGWAVSSAGDVNGDGFDDVLVGAPAYDTAVTDGGAVFLFYGSAIGLAAAPDWFAEFNTEAGARFGEAVASAGDVNGDGFGDIIVGAPYRDTTGTDNGIVFVWYGSATGLAATADWSALSLYDLNEFGTSVAGVGDVNGDGYDDIAVSAPNSKIAYGWFGGPGGLGPNGLPANADWQGTHPSANVYAMVLAGAGDVNGDGYDDIITGNRFHPRAYVHLGGPAGPSIFPDWSDWDQGAYGVAVSGIGDVNGDGYDDVAVGAWTFSAPEQSEGRVFVYYGSPTGLPTGGASWTGESDQVSARLGRSVAGGGDLNGDGFDDFVAGAISFDAGVADEGAVFAWLGSASGLGPEPMWVRSGLNPGCQHGLSVAIVGDVNGDGLDDLVAGSPQWSEGETDEGRVTLHYGSPGGLAATLTALVQVDQADAEFGESLATGDLNGDGFEDLVVGASAYDKGALDDGVVFAFLGSATGLDLANPWEAYGYQPASGFGRSVATLDVDDDGFDDVLVGAYLMDTPGVDLGAVFLWKGSALGMGSHGHSGNAAWKATNSSYGGAFGLAVAGADVDGDGDDDVVVGAPYQDGIEPGAGVVFIFESSAGLPALTPTWTKLGHETGDELGFTIARAGDVNGDGYEDVAFGLPSSDAKQGWVWVYHGSATGLGSSPDWTGRGVESWARFGRALAGAGDVNGDGYDDLLIGAPRLDVVSGQAPFDQGRAMLFYGSAAGLTPANGTPSNAPWSTYVSQNQADSGWAVGAGDVNGDGYADVLVGAPVASVALVVLGSSDGAASVTEWAASQPGAELGTAIVAGDFDGDGLDDVAVGAPNASAGQAAEGTVSIYRGSRTGPWFDLGFGKVGSLGTPRLLGSGSMVGGEPVQVVLIDIPRNEFVYLVAGFSTLYAPIKGGVLVPSVDLLFDPIPTGNSSVMTLPTTWPTGLVSGFDVYFQAWITDAATQPDGFTASNGLGATLP